MKEQRSRNFVGTTVGSCVEITTRVARCRCCLMTVRRESVRRAELPACDSDKYCVRISERREAWQNNAHLVRFVENWRELQLSVSATWRAQLLTDKFSAWQIDFNEEAQDEIEESACRSAVHERRRQAESFISEIVGYPDKAWLIITYSIMVSWPGRKWVDARFVALPFFMHESSKDKRSFSIAFWDELNFCSAS